MMYAIIVGNEVRVFENKSCLCTFIGPMACSAAATFIEACLSNRQVMPINIEKYFKRETA